MRQWIDVATLVKTKSLNGRFVARCAAGLSYVPEEGVKVAFVPPRTDAPRYGAVAEVSSSGIDRYEVSFEGVDDPEVARMLVGCHLLVKRELVQESLGSDDPAVWTHWRVFDEKRGFIGAVEAIRENPGQSLLEVRRADENAVVLVPIVEEIIVGVDEERQEIVVNLPQGLLDL